MSVFLDACRLKETEYTPVWFMRQTGRYLPSYRKIKGSKSVLEIAKNPLLASQAVGDAVNQLGVGAGVNFAGLMLPPGGVGGGFRSRGNPRACRSDPLTHAPGVGHLDQVS